jgi:hypothetical protein
MILILAVFVLVIVFSIGFIVGAKQQIKQIKKDGGYFDTEITGAVYPYKHISVFETDNVMGSEPKIPPCVGHELESQLEIEKGDINFMNKWIREKSGK